MILLPLVPNWSTPVRETHTFLTEVYKSRNGTEQRWAWRTTPRRRFEFSALLNAEKLDRVERLLDNLKGQTLLLPEVTRGVRTTSAIPISGTSVTIESAPDWLVAGALVTLDQRRNVELLTVLSVDDLTVTFDSGVTSSWGARSRLSPATEGHLQPSVPTERHTSTVATMSVVFDVLPAIETPDEGAVTEPMLQSTEILALKPNWSTLPSINFVYDRRTVDYDRGRIATIAPELVGHRITEATYVRKSAEDLRTLQQFFARMKGQRGEFFASTWKNDLPSAAPLYVGQYEYVVAGTEAFDAYGNNTVFRAIRIELISGELIYRRIREMRVEAGNTVIVVDEPWDEDLTESQIRCASWLMLSRFATDTLTIIWRTSELGEAVLNVRSLDSSVFLSELIQYMLNTYGEAFTINVLCNPIYEAVNITLPEIFA